MEANNNNCTINALKQRHVIIRKIALFVAYHGNEDECTLVALQLTLKVICNQMRQQIRDPVPRTFN